MDDWQYLEEVDVIAKWPSESKKAVFEGGKWSERKEALEVLNELMVKNPRLATSSMTIYGELMDEIRKILDRESNIVVVTTTIRSVELLAIGLRNKFAGFVGMVVPFLIKRAKDKKKNVRDAILAAFLAVSETTSSERLQKDIVDWFSIPSPESKQTLLSFIFSYFTRQSSLDLPFVKAIVPLCVKSASESDVNVREKACSALGSIRRLLGDGISAFLGPISTDSTKLDKIQQYEKEAVEEANKWAELKGISANQGENDENGGVGESTSTTENGTSTTATTTQIDPWQLLDPEDVSKKIDKSAESQIIDKNWKERVAGVESVKSAVESAGRLEISERLREIMILMVKIIEKDVNVNVAALAAQTLSQIAIRARFAYSSIANRSFPVIFDKLKDKKAVLRDALIELSDSSATTTPLSAYSEAVLGGLASKNPQSRQQTALFLARFFAKNDVKTMEVEAVKQLVEAIQKTSNDADKEVREATIRTVAAIQKSLGEPLAAKLMAEVYEDKMKAEKIPATITQLEEEFGKSATPEMLRLAAHYNLGQKKPATTATSAKPPPKKPASAPAARKPVTVAPAASAAPAPSAPRRAPISSAPPTRRAPSPKTVAPPPSSSAPKPFVARPAPNFGAKPKVVVAPTNVTARPISRVSGTPRPATSSAVSSGASAAPRTSGVVRSAPIKPNVVRSQPAPVTNRPVGIARPNTAGSTAGVARSRIAAPSGMGRPASGIPRPPSTSRIARPPSRNGSRHEIDRI